MRKGVEARAAFVICLCYHEALHLIRKYIDIFLSLHCNSVSPPELGLIQTNRMEIGTDIELVIKFGSGVGRIDDEYSVVAIR